jgi:hypothetical protein
MTGLDSSSSDEDDEVVLVGVREAALPRIHTPHKKRPREEGG